MVFYRLNHYSVLLCRTRDLHTTSATNAGMGNIAIASDLVRGIYDHHTLIGLVSQDASNFAQESRFAHTGATKNQDRLALFHNVTDQGNTAKYRTPNTARQADDLAFAVAHRADTVQSPFDTSAIIVAKFADTLNHVFKVSVGHRLCTKDHLPFWESALGLPTEVHHDLQQFSSVIEPIDRIVDARRKSS